MMTQDRQSGAEAAKFGLEAAALIAEKIGAEKVKSGSNEFRYKGQLITMHTARGRTNQIGVTYATLDRVQLVISAFEKTPNVFELRALSPEVFRAEMRDSPTGRGRVGLVRKKVFDEKGQFNALVSISTQNDAPG